MQHLNSIYKITVHTFQPHLKCQKSNIIENICVINTVCGTKIAQSLIPPPQISEKLIWLWHSIWQLTKNPNRKHFKVLESETYFWQYIGERELEQKVEKHNMVNVNSKISTHHQPESSQFYKRTGLKHGYWDSWPCDCKMSVHEKNKCTLCIGWNYIKQSSWPMGFFCDGLLEKEEKNKWKENHSLLAYFAICVPLPALWHLKVTKTTTTQNGELKATTIARTGSIWWRGKMWRIRGQWPFHF